MATCQSCFKKIPDDAGHCPHCGAAQHKADAAKKTVFGYAAGAELQKLQQQQQAQQQKTQQQPGPNDALAKTMFSSESQAHPAQEAAPPAQEPERPRVNVRAPQIDPALRTPLVDPVARATASQEQVSRDTTGPQPPAGRADATPSTPAASPPGGGTPAGGFPPTMVAPGGTGGQPAVPPTMTAPAPGPAAPAPVRAPAAAAPVPRPAGAAPRPGRVSAGLYLAFILGGIVITGGLTGLAIANMSHMHELLFFSWMPAIVSVVFFYILLYKAWAALQDGETPVSPGAAIGLLFVPFYNIYWIFVAFGSWGKHYNAYLERHGINAPRMSEGLFLAYPICCLVPIANLAAPVLAVIVILKWCEGINAIADAS